MALCQIYDSMRYRQFLLNNSTYWIGIHGLYLRYFPTAITSVNTIKKHQRWPLVGHKIIALWVDSPWNCIARILLRMRKNTHKTFKPKLQRRSVYPCRRLPFVEHWPLFNETAVYFEFTRYDWARTMPRGVLEFPYNDWTQRPGQLGSI